MLQQTETYMKASLSKQANRIRNLEIFVRHFYASLSSVFCRYLTFFIQIGNQRVYQSKISFLKVLVNHKIIPFY